MNQKGKILVQINDGLIKDVHYYLGQIKKELDSKDYWTKMNFEVLEFNRIVRYQTHRRVHFESLFLLRNGLIKIEFQSDKEFDISYSLSLNYLTFFSLLVGFAIGILGVFFSNSPVLVGIISAIVVYLYGFVGMRIKIQRIIKSVFKN